MKLKKLKIPNCWTILNNNFIDIEPDNNFEIDLIADNFIEDILQTRFKDYLIDLGFYGDYYNNRNGYFKLYVLKGDFMQGELYELFTTRSTKAIKEKLEMYFDIIPKLKLDKLNGIEYGNFLISLEEMEEYSILAKL